MVAHVKTKREELGLRYKKMHWLLGRNSSLPLHNKLLLLQPNTNTRMDIRYPTEGLHKTK